MFVWKMFVDVWPSDDCNLWQVLTIFSRCMVWSYSRWFLQNGRIQNMQKKKKCQGVWLTVRTRGFVLVTFEVKIFLELLSYVSYPRLLFMEAILTCVHRVG